MRALLLVAIPAVASAETWTTGVHYTSRSTVESSSLFYGSPNGSHIRRTISSRLSLELAAEVFEGPVVDFGAELAIFEGQAQRRLVPVHLGALFHPARFAYGVAGIGATREAIFARYPFALDEWLDSGVAWRPHAFVGGGIECRHDVGPAGFSIGLDVRALWMGGDGPAIMPRVREIEPLSVQGSLVLSVYE